MISVIVPTLNEEGNIESLCQAIWQHIPQAKIIVVDDSSTDKTQAIVRQLMAANHAITLIARTGKACLTDSIQAGIDASQTEFIAWLDADHSHPPALLPELLAAAQIHGCAIASRFLTASKPRPYSLGGIDSILAAFLSLALNTLVKYKLGIRISDYTSGFIVIRRQLLAKHKLCGDYGEYFIELMHFLAQEKIAVYEVAYQSPARHWGESKTGASIWMLMRRGVKYLWLVIRL